MKKASPTVGIFIAYGSSMTGGPRVAVNLAESLRDQGISPFVITTVYGELSELLTDRQIDHAILTSKRFAPSGGRILRQIWKFPALLFSLIAGWWKVFKLIRQERISVIWIRNIKGILLAGLPARLAGAKVVWDIGMEYKSRGLVVPLHYFGMLVANVVVTEGACVYDQVFTKRQHAWFKHKFKVNHSALPNDRVAALQQAMQSAAPINASDKHVRIICPASIQDRKNQRQLVKGIASALALLKREPSTIELVLAGPIVNEEYGDRLRKDLISAGLSEEAIKGWRDDVPELLCSSDIFALYSKNEGVPYSVLEAMHTGLAIVVSDAGGMPDVVEDNRTGLIVPLNQPDQLPSSLARLIESSTLREELGKQAQAYVRSEHSHDGWVIRYIDLFEELLKSPLARKDACQAPIDQAAATETLNR